MFVLQRSSSSGRKTPQVERTSKFLMTDVTLDPSLLAGSESDFSFYLLLDVQALLLKEIWSLGYKVDEGDGKRSSSAHIAFDVTDLNTQKTFGVRESNCCHGEQNSEHPDPHRSTEKLNSNTKISQTRCLS